MLFTNIYRDTKVLVTGHTGFKGSWLSLWLSLLGARVTGFALPPEHQDGLFNRLKMWELIHHVEGDIRDETHIKKVMQDVQPQFVFHLAAQPLVRRSYAEPKLTFDTNVGGAVNLLEAINAVDSVRVLIYVTSDKCYRNKEWIWGYRENDELGGHDPYSASKACAEMVFYAYQNSFWNHNTRISAASVRAGNVIGGGDWALDRIIPDCIKALREEKPISIRNPHARRPWQHVLEPLGGYLLLAMKLLTDSAGKYTGAWNFGPEKPDNRSVLDLGKAVIDVWGKGHIEIAKNNTDELLAESTLLHLNCDKAFHLLSWKPVWNFNKSLLNTVAWYKALYEGHGMKEFTISQIEQYVSDMNNQGENIHD
ncbi:MAG: CDP-glucose 4,6-dehydratase [Calditrichaceae bacterium]|nr:CDP-glucose 4,6-dehydratase [Calditrichia bacterium]NUQ42884.1 CDP-glucose 4,6-dehydratase [Calditrichaceae bacterium]